MHSRHGSIPISVGYRQNLRFLRGGERMNDLRPRLPCFLPRDVLMNLLQYCTSHSIARLASFFIFFYLIYYNYFKVFYFLF